MEALILILSEALSALLTPLLSALASLAASFLSLIGTLITALFDTIMALFPAWRRRAARRKQSAASAPWRKRLLIGLGLVSVLLVTAVLIVECCCDAALLQAALKRGGLDVQASSWRVTTLTGRVELEDVRIGCQKERMQADLTARKVVIKASLWSSLTGTIHFREVTVDGARGSVRYQSKKTTSLTDQVIARLTRRPGHFIIDQLRVSDADVAMDLRFGQHRIEGRLAVDRLTSEELGQRSLMSALLLRTSGQGTWLGAPFRVETGAIDGGRHTCWQIQGLPVAALAIHFGSPWDCLTGGTVDLDLNDRWSRGSEREITLEYHLRMSGLQVAAPAEADLFTQALAAGVRKAIQGTGGTLDLQSSVHIDRDHFETAFSDDLSSLGTLLVEGLVERLDPEGKTLRKHLTQGLDWSRKALDRWRKK